MRHQTVVGTCALQVGSRAFWHLVLQQPLVLLHPTARGNWARATVLRPQPGNTANAKGFMFSLVGFHVFPFLGFHVFPRRVSCFPLS